ncbi:hypothetical protein ACOT81_32800 [Streptomyces sp. WI04-05B]|nr:MULTISPECIES: hypothetical protein [unclassified Streptomyces]MDX3753231.1 hypothetical protein [Streptomyces sp. AK08-02]
MNGAGVVADRVEDEAVCVLLLLQGHHPSPPVEFGSGASYGR